MSMLFTRHRRKTEYSGVVQVLLGLFAAFVVMAPAVQGKPSKAISPLCQAFKALVVLL